VRSFITYLYSVHASFGSFSCVLCSVLFIWFGYNETKWKREPNQRRRTEQQHTPPVSRRVVLSFPLCIQFNSRFLSLPLQLNWIQRENKGHTRPRSAVSQWFVSSLFFLFNWLNCNGLKEWRKHELSQLNRERTKRNEEKKNEVKVNKGRALHLPLLFISLQFFILHSPID